MTDGGDLLGGAVLALSFALLVARPGSGLVAALAAQAAAVAAILALQGWTRGDPGLAAAGLVLLLAGGAGLPWALRRLAAIPAHADRPPARWLVPAGLALTMLSLLVLLPSTAEAPTREALAMALAVMLVGALLLGARADAPGRLAGLVSVAHGAVLAAGAVPGPSLAPLAVAATLPVAALAVGLVAARP